MSNVFYNVIVLVTCWLLVTGAGVYVTFFQQPEEKVRLEKAEKVARMKQAEVSALIAEEAASQQRAEEALRKWRARYKVIPKRLESSAVIAYMNGLTQKGFENFDISFGGRHKTRDYSFYVFNITGRSSFNNLYKFAWETENHRNFYRIRDLNLTHIDLMKKDAETKVETLEVMVSFTMSLEAYFGGAEGLSAEEDGAGIRDGGDQVAAASGLPEIPETVLPRQRPALNPFEPIIMEKLPPNTRNLVDVEAAKLVSIVGDKAMFRYDGEYRAVGVGEEVYLGEVTSVNPAEGKVVIRMNKGGIIDEVVLEMKTRPQYRQALGPLKLTPLESQ